MEKIKKEFLTEGLEFLLEPENGKYFVKKAGVDFDYINDFESSNIETVEDQILVKIVEYKYNVLRDDTILKITNNEYKN